MPFFTASDGVRLHYEVEGSGPHLILQTGGAGGGTMWRDAGYVAVLAQRRACVMLDHRGHGRSDQPSDPAAHRMERYVQDVVELLDHLGLERASFWGYSQGAEIGFGVAALHPDRVSALVATGANPRSTAEAGEEMADARRALIEGGWHAFFEGAEKQLSPWFQRQVRETNPMSLALWYEAFGDWDADALLARITAPVLMLVGAEEDSGRWNESAASRLRSARVVRLEGLDHVGAYERTDLALPEVLRFLDSVALEADAI